MHQEILLFFPLKFFFLCFYFFSLFLRVHTYPSHQLHIKFSSPFFSLFSFRSILLPCKSIFLACGFFWITRLEDMEGHRPPHPQHHHHRHHLLPQQQQQQPHISVNVDAGDRFPQWNILETKEFLMIRAELDRAFMETKRNKLLWEVISNKMKEKGYNRSAEQCKCKWKNLVTRYKVKNSDFVIKFITLQKNPIFLNLFY